jgi:hypothetical protein
LNYTKYARQREAVALTGTGGYHTLAFAALWTRWQVCVEGFMPIRIRHRDKNSASTQQPEMSLVATETALLSKVSWIAPKQYLGHYADRYKQCYAAVIEGSVFVFGERDRALVGPGARTDELTT